jgi:anti-sigma regulatory factor (Ser/Thr protein kinase)
LRQITGSVVLPARAAAVGLARAQVARGLLARDVPADLVADAQLVVSELMANAIRHARPLDGDTVRVTWRVNPPAPPSTVPHEIELAVSDGGAPWHPRVEHPPDDADGGRGLGIVSTLTSVWGVEGAGTEHQLVWAVLRSA